MGSRGAGQRSRPEGVGTACVAGAVVSCLGVLTGWPVHTGTVWGRLSRVDAPHEHKRLLTLLLWLWSSIVIINAFVFESGS